MTTTLFAFFGIGGVQLAIVAGIMLLLFGSRIPSVARSLGLGIHEFKRGLASEDEAEQPAVTKES